jgi:hypothetical protein
MHFFMITVAVFLNAKAGVLYSLILCAFPHYNILQIKSTAQYTETNVPCHLINISVYFKYRVSNLPFNIDVKGGLKQK